MAGRYTHFRRHVVHRPKGKGREFNLSRPTMASAGPNKSKTLPMRAPSRSHQYESVAIPSRVRSNKDNSFITIVTRVLSATQFTPWTPH